MKCPKCGTNNPDDFFFCLQCGAQLASAPPAITSMPSVSSAEKVGRVTVAGGSSESSEWQPVVSAGGAPGARLLVEQGSVDQRDFRLDQPVVVLGRRLGNDVVIHDTNVSRLHARIVRDNTGFAIEDTNSANGTIVNNERVEGRFPLQSGDVIRIGDAVFVFELDHLSVTEADPSAKPAQPSEAAEAPPASQVSAGLGEPVVIRPAAATIDVGAEYAPVVQPELGAGELSASVNAPPSVGGLPEFDQEEPLAGATAAVEPRQQELGDVGRDLEALVAGLGGVSERVQRLERSLAEAGADLERLAAATRGPDAEPLRELAELLPELEWPERAERLEPTVDLMERLAAQPRDIELLLKLSQQVEAVSEVVRLHRRLATLAPRLRESLQRILD